MTDWPTYKNLKKSERVIKQPPLEMLLEYS